MNTVTLTPKAKPDLYLEVDNINPDRFAGKTNEEIAALHLYEGSTQHLLGKVLRCLRIVGPDSRRDEDRHQGRCLPAQIYRDEDDRRRDSYRWER